MLRTVVLCLLCSKMVITTKDHSPQYYTAYACDGKMLKIECKEGYVINLIRANYGRYSITVCNDHGSTEWSVNCMSHKSFSILSSRCSQKRNCSIQASTNLFNDPCPGTVKYLEAHYACVSATFTPSTSRPAPPWMATSAPSWSTTKSISIHPEIVPPATPSVSTSSVVSSTKITPKERESEDNEWNNVNTNPPIMEFSSEPEVIVPRITSTEMQLSSSESPMIMETEKVPLCKPITIRNLSWNWTQGGDVSVLPCPNGAAGFAKWRCHKINANEAKRTPDTPDLSECRSVWLSSLENRISEGDSLPKVAGDLSQVTESKTLFGGDMILTAKIIRDMAQKMSKDVPTFPDRRQREAVVYDLLQNIARVGSNLLDISHQQSWKDLPAIEQMRIATNLLVGLEENSFLLADTTNREKIVNHCTKNMLLSIQVLEAESVDNEVFPAYPVVENCSLRINNWLQLPKSSLLQNSEGNLVRLVYVAFDTLEHILKAPSNSKEQKKINSKVLSASLGKGRHIQLNEPVILCLQHLTTENVSNPTCVFWDYTQSNWSEEGCTLIATNETHTMCRCTHLTNFAIMVDVKPSHAMGHVIPLSLMVFLICVVLILSIIAIVLGVMCVRNHNARRDYGSTFVPENEWFLKCFGCCQSSSESEKTLNCKEPRPALYGNPTMMESMTSVENAARRIEHLENTLQHRNRILANTLGTNSLRSHHLHHHHTYGEHRARKLSNTLSTNIPRNHTYTEHRNRKLSNTLGSNSPRSHTYSEIAAGSSRSDPVYEEIEREREHCSQISDISDDDAKRNSDMSRQSSKSYGDHRPLIPYNPVTDRNFHAALDAAYRQQLKEHSARTVSVLDGQTVVCHLQQML
ncbi:latrophilin Cirl-like [Planococcus citri]|uniref:latrophilin Cirl-like n=1 Tax=Planococcus citri TaxID=170843 RepID=UPI0031F89CD4